MALLHVQLNGPYGRVTLEQPISFEFAPDDVFRACNRIGTRDEDYASLEPWQQSLRQLIDEAPSYSMSVGDTIVLTTDGRIPTAMWRCERRGWSTYRPDPSQAYEMYDNQLTMWIPTSPEPTKEK